MSEIIEDHLQFPVIVDGGPVNHDAAWALIRAARRYNEVAKRVSMSWEAGDWTLNVDLRIEMEQVTVELMAAIATMGEPPTHPDR